MDYEQHILAHFSDPTNKGPMPEGSGQVYEGQATSTICGDDVCIQARIEDGVLTEVWWGGDGCCFAMAAASMLVEEMEGKPTSTMKSFTEENLFDLFRAEVSTAREGCVLVGLKALRNLLENYDETP
jgi:nitrogen fixation NifU-like protein